MKLIEDGRTLRALAKAGHISEPPEHVRPKGKKWGAGYCYVEPGVKNHFSHNGRNFCVSYRSGCFYPFCFAL